MSDEMVMQTPDSPAGATDGGLGEAFSSFIQDAAGPDLAAEGALNAGASEIDTDALINNLLGVEEDQPGAVPYERFREVNERAKAADSVSSELNAWQSVIDEFKSQGFNSAADVQRALAEQQQYAQEAEIRDRYERLQQANVLDGPSAYAQQEAELTRVRYERQMAEVQSYMLEKQTNEAMSAYPLAQRAPELVQNLIATGVDPANAAAQVHNMVRVTAQALLPDLTNRLKSAGAVTPMSNGRSAAQAQSAPRQNNVSTLSQLLGISRNTD